MSKGAQVTVLYPKKDGAKFDLEYYLATHMPLVTKTWSSYGLKGYTVTQLSGEGPYSISCVMEFESSEGFGKAIQDKGTAEVMKDVENFSSEKPVLVAGEIVERK